MFSIFRDGLPKSGSNDHQISTIQMMPSTNSLLVIGVNVFPFGIPRKQDFAFETMLLRQNFSQHRHAFFRAVFFISGDKHNGLTGSGFVITGQMQNIMMPGKNEGTEKNWEKGEKLHYFFFLLDFFLSSLSNPRADFVAE